jgi:hypothetical protein
MERNVLSTSVTESISFYELNGKWKCDTEIITFCDRERLEMKSVIGNECTAPQTTENNCTATSKVDWLCYPFTVLRRLG